MYQWIIWAINGLIKALGAVLGLVFALLPPSPFGLIDNSPIKEFLPTLNYFLPISEIVLVLETWVTAIGFYYLYSIVLRWIKGVS